MGSLAVELGSRRVREPTDSSGRLPPNAAAARYWFPSDGIAASAFRFPVLFMFGILADSDSCEAHSWFKLPPNRKEDRELLKLEVLEFPARDAGTSIKALSEYGFLDSSDLEEEASRDFFLEEELCLCLC